MVFFSIILSLSFFGLAKINHETDAYTEMVDGDGDKQFDNPWAMNDGRFSFTFGETLDPNVPSGQQSCTISDSGCITGLGLFSIKKIGSISTISKIIKKHSKNSNRFGKEILISQIVRNLINIMVMDVIKTTSKNIQKQRPKTLNDIYKQKFPLVDFSHKMKKIDKEIKSIKVKTNDMFDSDKVKKNSLLITRKQLVEYISQWRNVQLGDVVKYE